MKPPFLYLTYSGGMGPNALAQDGKSCVHVLPLCELETLSDADLQSWKALLIPAHVDQRFLQTQQARLEEYLLHGGTVVVNGHIAYPFLRWLLPFVPAPPRGLAGLQVHRAVDHPIFDGVDAEHLTFRKGVAGFYARGGNPVVSGALVLNTLGPEHVPVDWLLNLSGGGRLLVHSGNDMWMFANSNDSAARVVPQLLAWLKGDTHD